MAVEKITHMMLSAHFLTLYVTLMDFYFHSS